jgi:hypothetical protein
MRVVQKCGYGLIHFLNVLHHMDLYWGSEHKRYRDVALRQLTFIIAVACAAALPMDWPANTALGRAHLPDPIGLSREHLYDEADFPSRCCKATPSSGKRNA